MHGMHLPPPAYEGGGGEGGGGEVKSFRRVFAGAGQKFLFW